MKAMNSMSEQAISCIVMSTVREYVQGLLTTSTLQAQVMRELQTGMGDEQAGRSDLKHEATRVAQCICSRVLYASWHSVNEQVREKAFDNMRRYLEKVLMRSKYVEQWAYRSHSLDDVLHQTLETLYMLGMRGEGPNDPACFLKWIRTIALRQAYAFAMRAKENDVFSYDSFYTEEGNGVAERCIEYREPLKEVLAEEARQILADAIAKLRNPCYRQVLYYTYFLDMDGAQIVAKMQVKAEEVYTWRRRALAALRKQPEVRQLLFMC